MEKESSKVAMTVRHLTMYVFAGTTSVDVNVRSTAVMDVMSTKELVSQNIRKDEWMEAGIYYQIMRLS